VNIPAIFEVRSFTRSWDNRGYWKNLGPPWIRPDSLFSQIFNGLLLGCTVSIYLPNLKFVALQVPAIIGGTGQITWISMLKVVMSRLWRHRVTWRHRGDHHSIAPDHCAIGSQQESIRYLQKLLRYLALNVMSWWRHNWRNVVWINNLCGPSRHAI